MGAGNLASNTGVLCKSFPGSGAGKKTRENIGKLEVDICVEIMINVR